MYFNGFQKLANFTPKHERKLPDLLHSAGMKIDLAPSKSVQENIWKIQLVVNKGKYMRLNVSWNEIMHYIQSYISIFT